MEQEPRALSRDDSIAVVAVAVHRYILRRRAEHDSVDVSALLKIHAFASYHMGLDLDQRITSLGIQVRQTADGTVVLNHLQGKQLSAHMKRIRQSRQAQGALAVLDAWIGDTPSHDLPTRSG